MSNFPQYSLQITIRDKFDTWNVLANAITQVSAFRSFEGNQTHIIKWVVWSRNDKAHTCLFKSVIAQLVPELQPNDTDLELDNVMRKITHTIIGQINQKFKAIYILSPIPK